MPNTDSWASDTRPSLPQPMPDPSVMRVPLGDGFAFTANGLAHDLSEDDWEAQIVPAMSPQGVIPISDHTRSENVR